MLWLQFPLRARKWESNVGGDLNKDWRFSSGSLIIEMYRCTVHVDAIHFKKLKIKKNYPFHDHIELCHPKTEFRSTFYKRKETKFTGQTKKQYLKFDKVRLPARKTGET